VHTKRKTKSSETVEKKLVDTIKYLEHRAPCKIQGASSKKADIKQKKQDKKKKKKFIDSS